jgi:hypothetical protein
MDNTTMTMNAVSCVLSVRLRPTAGQVRLAAFDAPVQGTGLSIAGVMGAPVADLRSPIQGDVSVDRLGFAASYKTPDVVRSRSGRPPV